MKKLLICLIFVISNHSFALPCDIHQGAETAKDYFVSTFHPADQWAISGGTSSTSYLADSIDISIYQTYALPYTYFDNDQADYFIYLHFEGITHHHGDTTYMVSVKRWNCEISKGYLLYEE